MFNQMIKGIKTHGRQIEFLRLLHHLEGSYESKIIEALTQFQNTDGGFGHGLEPDNQDPNSSPLQCLTAMNILREMDFDHKEPIVISMYEYLLKSYHETYKRWPLYMKTVEAYPHAPWWDYKEIDEGLNPTASIIGFILKYAPKEHAIYQLAASIKEDIFKEIIALKNPVEMHELRCIIEMINDLDGIEDDELFSDVKESVLTQIDSTIEKNSSKWYTSYCATPTFLVPSKTSFGAQKYESLIKEELKISEKQIKKDGLWEPTFSWNHVVVDQIWKAIIALQYLKLYMMYQI